ncbi:ATPase, P-type, heavy metal translocating [Metarhizium album ARSEF 1941]|uniref:ATPase, P-type, heavy metal translocating n=1 Tax=Metarhizium album (strain ARSEF 1941) TaxID=1081103 RepID=A0A0B2X5P4_METAS|nr:ATPase, P-type, heavy metal translocating [Metarhizium album ARSEF 1941]KHO01704.1 ATPase, P-type, heavy metal translocating [Metarhizium album ARSEF 1941]
MAPPKIITTSFLVGNLHCPSCVAVIKNALGGEYAGRVVWVSPNVVTSVVTVEHEDEGADFIRDMGKTLEDVGFEICAVDTTGTVPDELNREVDAEQARSSLDSRRRSGGAFDLWWRLWGAKTPPATPHEGKAATHLDNCDSCKSAAAVTARNNGRALSEQLAHSALSPLGPQKLGKAASKATTTPLSQVVIDDANAIPGSWRATLSISGMTCASCSNTITDEIQKFPGVAKIVVNLVANSAAVDIKERDRIQDVVDAIDDLGYGASLGQVINLNETKPASADARDVEVQIDGIFCPKCPQRISKTLNNLGFTRIEIIQAPTPDKPFLKIRYIPRAPEFTIRHVLKAIEATDPSLQASIYHPPTLEERSKAIRAKHQRALFWRMILTLILAIPTFVIGIVFMSLVPDSNSTRKELMEPWKSGLSRAAVILCLLSTPVYFFAADIFHIRALKEIRTMWRSGSRTPLIERFYKFGSMNMLMSLGTTIAYVSSVAEMIAAAAKKRPANNAHVPESRVYFDSVVFLTLFLLMGRLIEAYSKSKTGDAVGALAKLRPRTALLVEQDQMGGQVTTTTPIDQLECGDIIRVPHGASPASDGIITSGETIFDESSLTGESQPIKKAPGGEVFAGTVNKGSAVTIRVTGTSGKSMLDQIIDAVREGQTKRAPLEQIADVMTSYFVPVITLIAVITWAVWLSLALTGHINKEAELDPAGGPGAFAFQFAIAVFVVACPCGLALAAPTAIFVGGDIAAKHGVLAKGGGEAFEKASKVDCVVFDKTGTLTEGGEPKITDSELFLQPEVQGLDKGALLAGLKAAEEQSSHPIAKAIVSFCGREVVSAELDKLEELPGRGMKASYKDKQIDIAVGNEHLMRDLSVTLSQPVVSRLQGWKSEAKSVAVVAVKSHEEQSAWALAGILSISDPVRREAAAVVEALRARGTQVWMLSGDNVTTAKAVGRQVGIADTNVLAEVLPSEKAEKVRYLQATLHSDTTVRRRHGYSTRRAMVAMVGDGINDSPALTTADVGIAIGSGSDVAISSADFVLASPSLGTVLTLLDLSRTVFGRIKINFGWAVVYNLLAVPIAAGLLYPVTTSSGAHVRLDPVWAALAMALSSISVILSSLSLKARVPGLGFRHSPVVVESRPGQVRSKGSRVQCVMAGLVRGYNTRIKSATVGKAPDASGPMDLDQGILMNHAKSATSATI